MKYIVVILLLPSFVFAQSFLPGGDSESQIIEKVKRKDYDGGPDEEDLKVIEEFQGPTRVVNIRQIQSSVYEDVLKGIEEEKKNSEEADSTTPANP